jgi:DNA-binding MarR family transcriptional regulator
MAPGATDRILEQLGHVVRGLTRISGGPDELPLSSTQRLALFELSESGPLRLAELAEQMGTSAPTASRAVDALVEHDLVERRPDPSDRRALQLELSSAGRERVAARKAAVAGAFRPAAAKLPPPDRERLVELLTQLAQALRD